MAWVETLPPSERRLAMSELYTEIVELVAPDNAAEGDRVYITVTIKNLSSSTFAVMVGAYLDYGVTPWPEVSFPYPTVNLAPGASQPFTTSFIMPNSDVKLRAYSYWWNGHTWHADDEATKDISLTKPAWVKLDRRAITLVPVTAPPTGWVKLDRRAITLTPVAAPPIPPEYEPVYQHEYPLGKTYVGKASEGTSTFNVPFPDQLFPNAFAIDRIVDAFEDKVEEQGERMLDLKIYIDTTPTWKTNFMIKSVCTDHSPFPWALVIIGILAIILVIAIKNLVTVAKDIDWGKPVTLLPVAAIVIGVLAIGAIAITASKRKRG